jgi:hypothetical protein
MGLHRALGIAIEPVYGVLAAALHATYLHQRLQAHVGAQAHTPTLANTPSPLLFLYKRLDSMDTLKATKVDVTDKLNLIKGQMPETYASIKRRAAEGSNQAFEMVRRGLRGEANCFYACEGGRVVGTPFSAGQINAEIALYIVEFGFTSIAMFGPVVEVAHGAH